jgi:hypothetical protein
MQLDGLEQPPPRTERVPVEDLGVYEAHGGHTLRRHVYTRPGDEAARIRREGVAAAGCFLNRATAQRCVDIALVRRSSAIHAWLAGDRAATPYTFVEDMGEVIGYSLTYAEVKRGMTVPTRVSAVKVVLRRRPELRGGFTVVTAYPTRSMYPAIRSGV